MAGLGAAAFFVGGEQQAPGPKVTPAVNTFLVQHAIVTGDLPVTPLTGGTAGNSGTALASGSGSVAAGVSAGGMAAAAVAGSQARSASRGLARGQVSINQASVNETSMNQVSVEEASGGPAGSMMRRGLLQLVPVSAPRWRPRPRARGRELTDVLAHHARV